MLCVCVEGRGMYLCIALGLLHTLLRVALVYTSCIEYVCTLHTLHTHQHPMYIHVHTHPSPPPITHSTHPHHRSPPPLSVVTYPPPPSLLHHGHKTTSGRAHSLCGINDAMQVCCCCVGGCYCEIVCVRERLVFWFVLFLVFGMLFGCLLLCVLLVCVKKHVACVLYHTSAYMCIL